jgi:hypothetical protein
MLPSAIDIFNAASKAFNIYREPCPHCKSKGCLSYYDGYERNLVAYENKTVQENRVTVDRYECSCCNKTHGGLPDVIIPFKSYSIIFILHVLKAYFFKRESETVAALCDRFGIAVSTLYAWKQRYLKHKTLYLGKLEKYLHMQDPHLSQPEQVCLTDILSGFFQRFGFSFLQYSANIKESRSHPLTGQ